MEGESLFNRTGLVAQLRCSGKLPMAPGLRNNFWKGDCPTLPMPAQVLACLCLGYLESAQHLLQQAHVAPEPQDLDAILQDLESQAATEQAQENPRQANRIHRRLLALNVFREHGLDQERLIQAVDLPEGYAGKILLIDLHGTCSEGGTCLRSGDLWHREILHDA